MENLLVIAATVILPLLLGYYIHLFKTKWSSPSRPPPPPGPKGWPIFGNLPQLGQKPHQKLAALARTYGPLFRLRFGSVNVVVAANSSTAFSFLKTHDSNFANRPPSAGAELMAYNYRDMVFSPYGPHWRMLRKLCNTHLFSAKALQHFHHVRRDEWAMAELIRHPDILLKLQKEIDSVVGCDRLVFDEDLPHLPYLQAVVKEGFRLHPANPLSLPRKAGVDCIVDGYHISKDTTLLVNIWAISRDSDTWKEPLEFRPERFLPDGERPGADVRGNDFEVIPFGAGRRICVGMNLGLRMVQLLVSTLAHTFDWELADGGAVEKLNMEESYRLSLPRAEPLKVIARKRLSSKAYCA